LNIYNQGTGRKQIPSQCFKFLKIKVRAKTAFFPKIFVRTISKQLGSGFGKILLSDPPVLELAELRSGKFIVKILLITFRRAVHIIQCIGPEPVLGHNDRQIFISLRPPPFQLNSIHNPSNLDIFKSGAPHALVSGHCSKKSLETG
jgi:hypothetical protein